ncbi:alpha-amylase family glycosyl hydrolase [Hymenobacter rubripertinctus]|uniref:T9SS C-terminal target domain-containing protein n=1 Tax=Hymenobacter rubripertinctus TaxID=2029981 RepID=A0A418R933_9BACT|nr:alpha-amylase family glycosyl hydrolase [Hymenobacter rubripertinctus]RIY14140.1 T9SS C-terminal target domain-containing protein [Hymenobacter rubripertinctus]
MKQLVLLLALLSGALHLRATPLTFRVDMRQLTVSAAGVHVAGTFQKAAGYAADWNPATTALTDPDGDNVYELTVNVPAGSYRYKFINGNAWGGAEPVPATCGQDDGGGNYNRMVTVGSSALRLPAIAFNGCATRLRFIVNMQGQTVSAAGIHVAGNFQALAGYPTDWDPAATTLTDDNADGVYEAEVQLPAPGRFQYKFINGDTWAGAEIVPAGCGQDDGSGNRNRTADALQDANVVGPVCFSSCASCGASPTNYTTHWWNDAVFYEVFVRSFYDSNGDGKGDFKGLMQKLDYLNDGDPATTTDLGVTALWLMPMMESPSYHGYDVTNYQATEPDYGTMAEFEAFMAAAHARGIKVIIDLVLNHSSDQHPWFTQAAGSATSPYRDWYRWSATKPSYSGPWGQTVWHPRNGSYYYGIFWSGMPDLNWNNPDLKKTMWDATRFWLNKGVDGYRLDAVKYLAENGPTLEDTPATLDLLHEFNGVVKQANANAFTVGEAWSQTPAVLPYVTNNRLDVCFEFDLAEAIVNGVSSGSAAGLRSQLQLVDATYPKLQYATFLTNHDQNRVLGQLGGNLARMKQAAALYLSMPGVPFLYYGEEVGLLGSGADEEKRKPMQWTAGTNAGFSTGTPWRSLNSNYAQFNVATQTADPASLLNHYKKLIALRTTHETLRKGYLLPVTTTGASLLGYARVYGTEGVVVAANLGGSAISQPKFTLPLSSLPAGGYRVTELYSGQAVGTLTLDAQGGFSSWQPTGLGALGANATWLLRLMPQTVTGTQPARSLSARLFPNPARQQAQVVVADPAAHTTITVFDLRGQLRQQATFSGPHYQLDTNAWPAGTYLVRVQSGKRTTVQRLVVVP